MDSGTAVNLNTTLGAAMIGGFLTAVLYGVGCVQCYQFFQRFNRDGPLLKYSIWAIWILNTGHLVFIIHGLYHFLVLNFGNVGFLEETIWSIPAFSLAQTISDVLVQSWYCHRVWIMSNKSRIATFPLILGVAAGGVVSIISDVKIFFLPSFSAFANQRLLFFVSLVLGTVTDVAIAVAMCYYLYKVQSPNLNLTNPVLKTLMVYSINTSLLTSVVAVAVFITSITMPDNFVFLALIFPLSELYSNCLLASLNVRGRLRQRIVGATTGTSGSIQLEDLEVLSRATMQFAHDIPETSPTSAGQSPRPRVSRSPRSDMPKASLV